MLPRRPELTTRSIVVADYTLALECDGTLAAVLSLLGQLPPSVALERLGAVRARGATQYRLTFAVFEASPGGNSQSSIAPLAELMSFAKPLAESLATPPVTGPTVTLSGIRWAQAPPPSRSCGGWRPHCEPHRERPRLRGTFRPR